MGERLQNSVFKVNSDEADRLRRELNTNNRLHVVELDGRNIESWNDYISEIQAKFTFPTRCNDSVDRYLDWIRDLDWLGKDGYVLIINYFDQFVRSNPNLRQEIISEFEQTVLPFWEDEVTRVVVGGKAKPFTVYLVSDSTF